MRMKVLGGKRGFSKAAEVEVNSKLGEPQRARREGKER